MTSYNISGSGGGSDAAVGGGGGLGSLLPHMTAATMDGAADGSSWFSVQQHHAGGPQLYYPPVVRASPARFGYALGGGQDGLRNGGGGFYPGGPLNSDGSLYSMPRLEDFLGASTPALSLDSSVFGGPSHHPHGNDQGGSYLQGIPVSGGHDVGGHSQLVDAHCAAAMAASWFAAHCGAYDVNGASAIVPRAHGHPHPLALSMSSGTGSQSSSMQIGAHTDSAVTELGRKQQVAKRAGGAEQVGSKSIGTIGQRTSQYRGVTRHRWTGRYEAHLWDNSCRMEGRKKKGRQVYLGGYDTEEKAARAYDLAALKYWGPSSDLNFPIEHYDKGEIDMMKNMTKAECVAHLRRKSSGFTRGLSIYRGVTRHHKHGQWQARISHVGRKHDLYLGTFASQREAAEAYDVAAIKFRGENAVTNFEISRYDVAKIMETNLPPFLQYEQFRRRKSNKSTLVVSEAATAEMVRAGGVADTCKKIQAAELPAATVDRVRGGGQQQEYQHQEQHQDLLSSEASLLQLLSTVCVDAAGSGGGATAHTLVVSEAAAAEMMRAGSGNGGVADTWKKILAAALPAATVDRVRGGGQEQEYQHQDLLSSEASLLQLLSTVSVDAAGTGAGGSATTRMSGNSRAQSPDSGSLAIVRQGRGVVGAQQAGPASAGILALAVDGGVSSSARPFAHLPMYVRRADQRMN